MRVLVTGGTGFVGCHTVAALIERGHAVRLLVRNPARVERALAPFGIHGVDTVVGDVTDAAAVRRAIAGAEALVHAAAVFTLDQRRAEAMWRVNVTGSERVLGAAVEAGLDPIVHVSSVSALFPPRGSELTPDEPVKQPRDAYAASKAEAERLVRRYQEQGAPLVSVYPGSVWGPRDPTLAEGIRVILFFVRAGVIPVTPGGIPIADVRDIAAVHAAAMAPGRGPKRYMIGGRFLRNAELGEALTAVTGRRLLQVPIAGSLIRGVGRVGDALQRHLGVGIGLTHESTFTLTRGVPCDDSRIEAELGVRCRPVQETLRDALRWMFERGILSARAVGRLAE